MVARSFNELKFCSPCSIYILMGLLKCVFYHDDVGWMGTFKKDGYKTIPVLIIFLPSWFFWSILFFFIALFNWNLSDKHFLWRKWTVRTTSWNNIFWFWKKFKNLVQRNIRYKIIFLGESMIILIILILRSSSWKSILIYLQKL